MNKIVTSAAKYIIPRLLEKPLNDLKQKHEQNDKEFLEYVVKAIVGNPETGTVHGGAITTLMDTTCCMASVCVLPEFEICPTLDLRIDYMRPAEPDKDIFGFAECYRVTPHIVFSRGYAYQDDPSQPIAHAVGTFMRRPVPAAEAHA